MRVLSKLVLTVIFGGLLLGLGSLLFFPALSNLTLFIEPGTLSTPLQLRTLAYPSKIYDAQGNLLYVMQGNGYRIPITLAQVPTNVINAVLDVEDHTFYQHGPIDLKSIARALSADVSGGTILEGGSTITQQLVKNTILTPQRTLSRKIQEAIDSYRIEGQFTKSQILQKYLNTVYFGDGAYGIGAAAKTYFNLSVDKLSTAQAALLAILIEDPSGNDPFLHPANALARRNVALDQMVQYNDLTQAQANQDKLEALPQVSYRPQVSAPSTFVQEVINRILTSPKYLILGSSQNQRLQALNSDGLQIYTTLNSKYEAEAQAAVKKIVPNTNGKYTAALVSMDPSTGAVEALVSGNPSHGYGGYDVVTGRGGTGRQPGSSFKPIVLAALLQQGYSPSDIIDGTGPCQFVIPNVKPSPYIVHNAEPGYGLMTITKATADSVNCAYVRLGVNLGDNNIVNMAHIMGVTSPLTAVPSIAIGSEDVTPLEMAEVYSTLADNGIRHTPYFTTKILDPNGKTLIQTSSPGVRVLSAQNVEVEDQVMQAVVQYGTGTAAAIPGREIAGKTGTTDNFTDGWFNGFTPQLETAVWMGDPAGSVPMTDVGGIPVYGGTYPAEIWHAYMSQALAGLPIVNFPPPNPALIPPGKFIVPIDSPGAITTPPTTSTTTTTLPAESSPGTTGTTSASGSVTTTTISTTGTTTPSVTGTGPGSG
ncbi:MAG: transglycosylase domain-containing protein [Actinomycetota bacterium]|nr:transglycosylase domain-containing protein [Actinomycetota bacterium]